MAQPPTARPVIARPVVAAPAGSTASPANGAALERQLDALLKPTTVEDLARKGGQIKAMKERDLRELIRQSLLTLMQSSTSLAGLDQEQLLDQVQGELKRTMAAKASESAEREALHAEVATLTERRARTAAELAAVTTDNGRLHDLLADAEQETARLRAELEAAHSKAGVSGELDAWAHEIDVQWFAGHHQRERAAGASLLESLAGHLAACQQLLADYPADPPGDAAAGDVIARIKTLVALRKQDQGWIVELQKRQGTLLEEREKLRQERESSRLALEEELARSIEAEAHAENLAGEVAALQQRIVDLEARPTATAPAAVWNEELAELRERIAESQTLLEDASAARIRAERELATTATGRATAERRLAESESRVTELTSQLQTLEAQVTDQRKTTDIARLASVEAEALRAESEGLKLLLREREAVLADERARAHADRDRHRAENTTRLEAMRRVELVLVQLKEQLAATEQQLAERDAERTQLLAEVQQARNRPAAEELAAPARTATHPDLELRIKIKEIEDELQRTSTALAAAESARRLTETENAALRAHHADAVALQGERDWLRQALLAFAPRSPPEAPVQPRAAPPGAAT